MNHEPEDNRGPGRFIMLATVALIYIVLMLSQAINRLALPPKEMLANAGNESVEERFADGYSWQMTLRLQDWKLEAHLLDKRGQAVKNGIGVVKLLDAEGTPVERVSMTEIQPGIYIANLPEEKSGDLAAQVEISTQSGRMMRIVKIRF